MRALREGKKNQKSWKMLILHVFASDSFTLQIVVRSFIKISGSNTGSCVDSFCVWCHYHYLFIDLICYCLCFGLSELFADAVLLTCMYHFKQPEASNSSNTVSAPVPHQLCCHGECMPFCVVAMGTPYYSLPPAPIMFLHVHLYASCTLMLLKKNISGTGGVPWGIALCRNTSRYFVTLFQRMTKIPKPLHDLLTVTLHVWQ